MIHAPWSTEQVASLNAYQTEGAFHPFTGKRAPDGSETLLLATPEGWREAPDGPVVQTWAHEFMTDYTWRD